MQNFVVLNQIHLWACRVLAIPQSIILKLRCLPKCDGMSHIFTTYLGKRRLTTLG
jgi:hypothetical protein